MCGIFLCLQYAHWNRNSYDFRWNKLRVNLSADTTIPMIHSAGTPHSVYFELPPSPCSWWQTLSKQFHFHPDLIDVTFILVFTLITNKGSGYIEIRNQALVHCNLLLKIPTNEFKFDKFIVCYKFKRALFYSFWIKFFCHSVEPLSLQMKNFISSFKLIHFKLHEELSFVLHLFFVCLCISQTISDSKINFKNQIFLFLVRFARAQNALRIKTYTAATKHQLY